MALPSVAAAEGPPVVTGDFNGDAVDDLALGAPGENASAGAVSLFFGATSADRLFAQGNGVVKGVAEPGDRFGAAVAAGAFPRGDDLTVGAPGENSDSGVVSIVFGGGSTDTIRSQATSGVKGTAEPGDEFGSSLATGALGRGGDDLAIAAPGEDAHAGVLNLLFGATPADALFSQASPGHPDAAEPGDRFGAATLPG